MAAGARGGAQAIIDTVRKRRSWPKRLFAGGAYDQGKPMSKAAFRGFVIDVVRRADHPQARPT